MPTSTELLDSLVGMANPEGGWGYTSPQPSHIEPTCLALLALAPHRSQYQAAFDHGYRFLRNCRRSDGSYRLERGRHAAVWGTSMALVAECHSAAITQDHLLSAAFLLSTKGRILKADPEVADMSNIDTTIAGWPWALDNFSWVEPTAWACLALSRLGFSKHERVKEGHRFLIDRMFEHGGSNYGNRRVLTKNTEPMPIPTALSLIALQCEPEQQRVQASVAYLLETLSRNDDIESLSWGVLALDRLLPDTQRHEIHSLNERLRSALALRSQRSWVPPSPLCLALSVLALEIESANPFRLDPKQAQSVEPKPRTLVQQPFAEKLRDGLQGILARGLDGLRTQPARSDVHIARVEHYEDRLLDRLLEQFAYFRELVPLAGKRVVLKPNIVEFYPERVINTDPRFIAAVIELCQREGASEVIVAEGPGHYRTIENLVATCGLGDVLSRYHVRFVDINHDEPMKVLNLGRLSGLSHLYLSRTVVTADVFISLPKLKTHHWAGATVSLKNLFGTLPGIAYGWPKNELHWRGIDNCIVDIALSHTPHLAIVDGIVGMEGDGPINGTPKHLGAIVMGTDLVAVDATACRLMGFPAERIPYLVLAAAKRLGRIDETAIPQLGEPIRSLATAFEPPPHFEKLLIPRSA